MKTILGLVLFLACSIQARAQGTVNFANNTATAVSNSCTLLKLVTGNTFTAELWYAPDTGNVPNFAEMVPLAGARTGISPIAGLITGGTKTTPNTTAPGAPAYFQIRVWETAYASSWPEALATPGGLLGASNIIRVETGNPGAVPPGLPGSLVSSGLRSFYVGPLTCPEPSTYAFGTLGLALLCGLRRKPRS